MSSMYNTYLVNLTTPKGSVQVTISAFDSGTAGRMAQQMYPGSAVTRIEKISGN